MTRNRVLLNKRIRCLLSTTKCGQPWLISAHKRLSIAYADPCGSTNLRQRQPGRLVRRRRRVLPGVVRTSFKRWTPSLIVAMSDGLLFIMSELSWCSNSRIGSRCPLSWPTFRRTLTLSVGGGAVRQARPPCQDALWGRLVSFSGAGGDQNYIVALLFTSWWPNFSVIQAPTTTSSRLSAERNGTTHHPDRQFHSLVDKSNVTNLQVASEEPVGIPCVRELFGEDSDLDSVSINRKRAKSWKAASLTGVWRCG